MSARLPVSLGALVLSACAIWPPGEDPTGKEFRDRATPVLTALISYHEDRGAYPSSIYMLVPRYLNEVPLQPNLNFDRERQRLEFVYEPSWPQHGYITCTAAFGDTQWSCSP